MAEADRMSSRLKTFSGEHEKWKEWRDKFLAYLYLTDAAVRNTIGTERPGGEVANTVLSNSAAQLEGGRPFLLPLS